MIEKKLFPFFDQSDKTIKHSEPDGSPQMGRTEPLLISKKDKVKQFYKE